MRIKLLCIINFGINHTQYDSVGINASNGKQLKLMRIEDTCLHMDYNRDFILFGIAAENMSMVKQDATDKEVINDVHIILCIFFNS